MEQWLQFLEQTYGGLDNFNQQDYKTRYQTWEDFINGMQEDQTEDKIET